MKKVCHISTVVFVTLFVMMTGCHQKQSPKNDSKQEQLKGNISISGAFALYPLTIKWAEEFTKIHPKIRIDVSAGGAGKGLADALSGMVDLGMFSRGLTQIEIDKGTWWIAVAKDGVVCTCNENNPIIHQLKSYGLSHEKLKKIFVDGSYIKWGNLYNLDITDNINVYTRSDACGAAQEWAQYLDKDQEDLYGIGVFGDPGMADAIKNDVLGIGYNNIIYVYDMRTRLKYTGLEVIPIDLDNSGTIDSTEFCYENLDKMMEAIKTGFYPSPPARDLYFVSNGKPYNDITIAFLTWVLTDGQQFVNECGYVELAPNHIELEKAKL